VLDPRARRIADNESRFREINDRLEADLRRVGASDEAMEFVCECGHIECVASVKLTPAEYERVRGDATTFALLPGHEIEDVEDVVNGGEGYVVVRKRPEAWPVVQETDPRA
jgi:hypothetical protein